jgi:hypothetical protein
MNPGVQLRIQVCVATRLLRVTTTVPALAEIRLGIPEKVSSADVDFNVSQRRPGDRRTYDSVGENHAYSVSR